LKEPTINQQQYVVLSLELHLFFSRIMKEHAIFIEAGFTPKNHDYAKTANQYKELFETVLYNAFQLGNGIISEKVATSGEVVTDYTLGSEMKTQNFTGINIDTEITRMQGKLYGSNNPHITPELVSLVKDLNKYALKHLEGLIEFKTKIQNSVLSCEMFTANYPSLYGHVIAEAKTYKGHIKNLESGKNIDVSAKESELFWDEIMMEHAKTIRGTLDPSEDTLITTANDFAKEYAVLLEKAKAASEMSFGIVTQATLQETMKFHDFKKAGVKGINECKVRSVILPLLADHVLREANHYIRLLKGFGYMI